MYLTVANTSDRLIQGGSHYHFGETNAALAFDRAAARSCRLDLTAGTTVRFGPGQARDVRLVPTSDFTLIGGCYRTVLIEPP